MEDQKTDLTERPIMPVMLHFEYVSAHITYDSEPGFISAI